MSGKEKMHVTEKEDWAAIGEMIPGHAGIYRINKNVMETLYFSEGIPGTLALSRTEYLALTKDDALEAVCVPDRRAVIESIRKCIAERAPTGVYYRVHHKEHGINWVHAQEKVCGEADGCPVISVAYTNASSEADMYHKIVERTKQQVYVVDCSTMEVLYANPAALKNKSLENGISVGMPCYALLHGKSSACSGCFMRKLKYGEELELTRRNEGNGRWEYLTGEFITWCGHEAFIQYIEDITSQVKEKERYTIARRQMELAHQDTISSTKLNLTRDWCGEGGSSPDSALKLKKPGNVDGYIQEFCRQIADDSIRTEVIRKFKRTELLKRFYEGITRDCFRYPVIKGNSRLHWCEGQIYMLQNPENGDVEAYTYAVDIDEKKSREEIAKAILKHAYGFIILLDMDSGQIIFGGETAENSNEKYRNNDYTEAMRTALVKMMPGENLEEAVRLHSIENIREQLAKNKDFQLSLETKDGKRYHWTISYADNTHHTVVILRADITEAMRQEKEQAERLRHAMHEAERANSMKTEFLTNVTHDMRTPLNAVLGYADLAQMTDNPVVIRDYLSKIKRAGDIMLTLVNDTLNLSKIESGAIVLKPAPIGCGEVIGRVLNALRPEMEKKYIHFTLDNSRAVMATVNIDTSRVEEIFINLLSNAVKFTPEGGNVAFIVECLKLEPACVHDRIIVRDSGCGISPEFLQKLFEPFSQERTKENADIGGSGLGLSIVKRLVDIMGGTIDVKSRPGEGTEVTVCLDLERVDEKIVPEKTVEERKESLSGKRVLMCEDNFMNREIAEKLLAFRGMTVECAENGKAGFEMFRNSEPGYYDLILMDHRMPVMDGFEATRRIRALERTDAASVPIFAMSADAFANEIQRCKEAGMNGHIAKPIDPETMYRKIADSFSEKSKGCKFCK
ncbi:MAG TPA: ATP-binding protein [Lachnospiraceae bacterium]|nr:ATP-binding protein [Lachnospiraceae bacterium]